MDIQKLCEDSHRISKEKGWLEDPRPFDEICDLFHSELSEALEDYRNNLPIDKIYYEVKFNEEATFTVTMGEPIFRKKLDELITIGVVKSAKPCGIPIEFADFIIRIAQYCGTNGLDLNQAVIKVTAAIVTSEKGRLKAKSFGEVLAYLHADISMAFLASVGQEADAGGLRPLTHLAIAWATCWDFCQRNGINLEEAIREKQAYNETRPHRHGGKKI